MEPQPVVIIRRAHPNPRQRKRIKEQKHLLAAQNPEPAQPVKETSQPVVTGRVLLRQPDLENARADNHQTEAQGPQRIVETLRVELREQKEKNERLTEDLSTLRTERDGFAQLVTTLQTERDGFRDRLVGLETDKAVLSEDLAKATESLGAEREKNAKERDRLSGAYRQLQSESDRQVAEFKTHVTTLKEKAFELEASLQDAVRKNEGLTAENASLQETLKKRERSIRQFKAKVEKPVNPTAEAMLKMYRDNLAVMKKDNEELEQKVDSQSEMIAKLRAELCAKNRQIISLTTPVVVVPPVPKKKSQKKKRKNSEV